MTVATMAVRAVAAETPAATRMSYLEPEGQPMTTGMGL
jgi:hypothetical protein